MKETNYELVYLAVYRIYAYYSYFLEFSSARQEYIMNETSKQLIRNNIDDLSH